MSADLNTTETTETTEEHRNLYEVFFDFIMEIFGLFKYLFNDMWLGKEA